MGEKEVTVLRHGDSIIVQKTPFGSIRLHVDKSFFENRVTAIPSGQHQIPTESPISIPELILDRLSIWGGMDWKSDTQFGWEFDAAFTLQGVFYMVKKLFPQII